MNRIMKVFRYQIVDMIRPVVIYYVIIAALVVVGLLLPLLPIHSNIQFGGFRLATTIFLLITGLNSFKPSFLFLQANGITRRQFYAAGVAVLAAITVSMTAVDAILYALLGMAVPVVQVPIQYSTNGYVAGLLWTLALNLLSGFFGWLVTMLYYRANKMLKIVISLLPALLFIFLSLSEPATGVWSALMAAFKYAMGLVGTPNAYIASLSMLIASGVCLALSFLLIRTAPVKEQER